MYSKEGYVKEGIIGIGCKKRKGGIIFSQRSRNVGVIKTSAGI